MNRSDFEKSIYVNLLKDSFIFNGKHGFSDIAQMAILAANKFYEEKSKDLKKQYPEIQIYDHDFDYGNELVKVIHNGTFYYARGINSIRRRESDNVYY